MDKIKITTTNTLDDFNKWELEVKLEDGTDYVVSFVVKQSEDHNFIANRISKALKLINNKLK